MRDITKALHEPKCEALDVDECLYTMITSGSASVLWLCGAASNRVQWYKKRIDQLPSVQGAKSVCSRWLHFFSAKFFGKQLTKTEVLAATRKLLFFHDGGRTLYIVYTLVQAERDIIDRTLEATNCVFSANPQSDPVVAAYRSTKRGRIALGVAAAAATAAVIGAAGFAAKRKGSHWALSSAGPTDPLTIGAVAKDEVRVTVFKSAPMDDYILPRAAVMKWTTTSREDAIAVLFQGILQQEKTRVFALITLVKSTLKVSHHKKIKESVSALIGVIFVESYQDVLGMLSGKQPKFEGVRSTLADQVVTNTNSDLQHITPNEQTQLEHFISNMKKVQTLILEWTPALSLNELLDLGAELFLIVNSVSRFAATTIGIRSLALFEKFALYFVLTLVHSESSVASLGASFATNRHPTAITDLLRNSMCGLIRFLCEKHTQVIDVIVPFLHAVTTTQHLLQLFNCGPGSRKIDGKRDDGARACDTTKTRRAGSADLFDMILYPEFIMNLYRVSDHKNSEAEDKQTFHLFAKWYTIGRSEHMNSTMDIVDGLLGALEHQLDTTHTDRVQSFNAIMFVAISIKQLAVPGLHNNQTECLLAIYNAVTGSMKSTPFEKYQTLVRETDEGYFRRSLASSIAPNDSSTKRYANSTKRPTRAQIAQLRAAKTAPETGSQNLQTNSATMPTQHFGATPETGTEGHVVASAEDVADQQGIAEQEKSETPPMFFLVNAESKGNIYNGGGCALRTQVSAEGTIRVNSFARTFYEQDKHKEQFQWYESQLWRDGSMVPVIRNKTQETMVLAFNKDQLQLVPDADVDIPLVVQVYKDSETTNPTILLLVSKDRQWVCTVKAIFWTGRQCSNSIHNPQWVTREKWEGGVQHKRENQFEKRQNLK